MRTLRLNLLLFAILLILVGPATATVTFNNLFPATLYRTVGTSIVFNWTGIADDINLSNNLTSFLFITPTNNETHFIQNATVTNCKNNTVCSATVSGFGAGFYQWYVLMMDNDGNTSLGAKWFEIVDTTNESLFYWTNDSGFVAMTLDKNSGELVPTGGIVSGGGQSTNWTAAYTSWKANHTNWDTNLSSGSTFITLNGTHIMMNASGLNMSGAAALQYVQDYSGNWNYSYTHLLAQDGKINDSYNW